MLFIFLFVVLIFHFIYLLLNKNTQDISARMSMVIGKPEVITIRQKELNESFAKRMLTPFGNKLIYVTSKILPSKKEEQLTKKLELAGKLKKIGPKEFIAIKLTSTAALLFFVLVFNYLSSFATKNLMLIIPGALIIGWLLPNIYLQKVINERKNEIEKAIPDFLDLITVSMEAGIGFDGAILKVVEKSTGPLAEELSIMLQEYKMGKKRGQALKDMAQRTLVEDVTAFAGSVTMAEQLGLSLGHVLRLQSDQARQKRRQRAEAKAMKAPVKMLIPMVICIFPSIFVILLGPAIINFYKNFS
ncbi:MAG: type II secretion system F family protein [Peptococcaceae bacterium]|nr:type II secretion system F family protein [Peptococcaceae bacterium]